MLLAHLDAARRAPQAWLLASWWAILGKRVRSRAQFAPLLAASPRAYRIWLCNEPVARCEMDDVSICIIALVAAGPGQEATMKSLEAQGLPAFVVGTNEMPGPAAAVDRIDWNDAPWLMPLAAGDILAPGAVEAYRAIAADTAEPIVYADDDILDAKGRRILPHFKPAWNAELFRHFDYLTGACIVRVSAQTLAGLPSGDWPARLIAAGLAKGTASSPYHIPHVLHHRLRRPAPRIPAVAAGAGELPLVSVIVPTRNRLDLLRTCLEGVTRTSYPSVEVIVVDNGSDDPATLAYLATLDEGLDPIRCKVLRQPGPFNFSKLNNRAAEQAKGQLLCLLNNDIEVIAPDWLEIMARQALREDVGAVGARLLYPDGRIQHAGVVLGVGGGAAHAHRLLAPDEEGYFRRHALPQFVSAVTAACLVVQRKRFEAVGGLNEVNFAVAFNDVDLCLRLNAKGWQSFYEPRATLVHHESVSRGLDRDPVGAARFARELQALKARWATSDTTRRVDPFHHPQLSPFSERFVVRL